MRSRFLSLMLGAALAAGIAAAAAAQSSSPVGTPAIGAPPAGAPPAGALTDAQAAALQGMIHDYILDHPDILIESLHAAKRRMQADAEQAAQRAVVERHDELLADPDAPVGGNLDGDVTIVEFFDYRCPYCKQVEPEIRAMLTADPKLRIVYKEYPVLGPASVYAARVALAARKQGKYQLFHDAMLATKGQIDDAATLRIARLAGLDIDRLKTDMADPAIDAIIRRNIELAKTLQLRGTPGFVIGNELVDGAASVETLRKYVDEARAKPG